MRQAGRYLPEYRRLRERYSFLSVPRFRRSGKSHRGHRAPPGRGCRNYLCGHPVASHSYGPRIALRKGRWPAHRAYGPHFCRRGCHSRRGRSGRTWFCIRDRSARARGVRAKRRSSVLPVRRLRSPRMPSKAADSRNYTATKTLMHTDPKTFHRFMGRISEVTAQYLKMQVDAGAHAIQMFDMGGRTLAARLPHVR